MFPKLRILFFSFTLVASIQSKENSAEYVESPHDANRVTAAGDSEVSSPNANVVAIKIDSQVIPRIPSGFLSSFRNVEDLQITNSRLREIHKENLEPFKKLDRLILNSNEIEELEKDLFVHNKALQHIYFLRNHIRTIKIEVFAGLNLRNLNLCENECMKPSNDPKIEEFLSKNADKCSNVNEKTTTRSEITTKHPVDGETSTASQEPTSSTTEISTSTELTKTQRSTNKRVKRALKSSEIELKIAKISIEFRDLPVINNSFVEILQDYPLVTSKESARKGKVSNLEYLEPNESKPVDSKSDGWIMEPKQLIAYASTGVGVLITLNVMICVALYRRKGKRSSYKCEIAQESRDENELKGSTTFKRAVKKKPRKEALPTPPDSESSVIYANSPVMREVVYTDVTIAPKETCIYMNLRDVEKPPRYKNNYT